METAIEIRSVTKAFRRLGRRTVALEDVSLEIRRGETFGLIGPNGAGKTTLLSCLLGFLRPDSGEIRIEGREADDLKIRESTGYMPERLGFDRFQTGRAFLSSHFRLAGGDSAQAPRVVESAARCVGLETAWLSRRLRTYSRGMLQRIGMAQATLRDPKFLFLDEPASGIDPAGVRTIRERILEAKARGATIVVNSHQLPEIEKVCDRIAFLDKGRLRQTEALRGVESLRKARVRVRPDDAPRAAQILEQAGQTVSRSEAGVLRFAARDEEGVAEAARALCGAGIPIYELSSDADLESLFEADPK
jgi:ABC-2 type transport system ATP-binding protein